MTIFSAEIVTDFVTDLANCPNFASSITSENQQVACYQYQLAFQLPPASTKFTEKQFGHECVYGHRSMKVDQEKIQQAVLALLYLTSFKDKSGLRTWKAYDWEVMNSLHEKGYISNRGKAKSVVFTEDGAKLSKHYLRNVSLRNKSRAFWAMNTLQFPVLYLRQAKTIVFLVPQRSDAKQPDGKQRQ